MYTLDLRDVALTPTLSEDAHFEHEERFALEDQVVAHITSTYGELYPNTATVERKVREAVRDAQGKTDGERADEEQAAFMGTLASNRSEDSDRIAAVHAEFEPKFAELQTWFRTEASRIMDEHMAKVAQAEPDAKEAIREDEQLALDALKMERQKRFDALFEEQAARIAASAE